MEPLTFYNDIEKKKCSTCGCHLEEQAECYTNLCNNCIPVLTKK